jgi:hypothetical protein
LAKPLIIAWYNHVKPWSEEHKAPFEKHLRLYAEAGGKFINTYVVHSPWSDNSYSIEETMIEWVKEKNGSWKFDYHIFDQYVQLAMEAGISKASSFTRRCPGATASGISMKPRAIMFTRSGHPVLPNLKMYGIFSH